MPTITIRGGQTIVADGLQGQHQGSGFNTVFATGTWSSGVLSVKIRPSSSGVAHSVGQTLSADGFFNFQAKYHSAVLNLSGATTQSLTVNII